MHPESPRQLFDLYCSLREHFGFAPQWWPGTPDEIALTAVLVQQCSWDVAWDAVLQLRESRLTTLSALAGAEEQHIHQAIRRVTFGPTKAKRLKQIAGLVLERGETSFAGLLNSASTRELRPWLLTLPGFGRETTDAVLLYAGNQHPVFVVDAYARRIFSRLDSLPLPEKALKPAGYEMLRTFVEQQVREALPLYRQLEFPDDVPLEVAIFRDLHAQLVELARHHCHRNRPRCQRQGAGGWPGYAICENHCLPEICGRCPLSETCDFPQGEE